MNIRHRSLLMAGVAVVGISLGGSSHGAVVTTPLGGGWQASVVDNLTVSIVVDQVTPDHVAIQIFADFVEPPDSHGVIAPLLIEFQQIEEDAVPRIVITDEAITNATGYDWYEFFLLILGNGDAWLNEPESAGLTVDPFLTKTFGNYIRPGMARYLVATGGVMPSFGATWFPGGSRDPDDHLVIEMNVGTASELTSFTFKQFPAVEPVAVACYGDFDFDGDVDGSDFARFARHFSGSGVDTDDPLYDSDSDGDCDSDDFAVFNLRFTGPNNPCRR